MLAGGGAVPTDKCHGGTRDFCCVGSVGAIRGAKVEVGASSHSQSSRSNRGGSNYDLAHSAESVFPGARPLLRIFPGTDERARTVKYISTDPHSARQRPRIDRTCLHGAKLAF